MTDEAHCRYGSKLPSVGKRRIGYQNVAQLFVERGEVPTCTSNGPAQPTVPSGGNCPTCPSNQDAVEKISPIPRSRPVPSLAAWKVENCPDRFAVRRSVILAAGLRAEGRSAGRLELKRPSGEETAQITNPLTYGRLQAALPIGDSEIVNHDCLCLVEPARWIDRVNQNRKRKESETPRMVAVFHSAAKLEICQRV